MLGQRDACDPQVLGKEPRAESRRVVGLQHPLPVDVQNLAGGESAEQRVPDERDIHVRLARQRERFADRGERAANHHLIADLADLTRA